MLEPAQIELLKKVKVIGYCILVPATVINLSLANSWRYACAGVNP
jgi:hypothetical protein